MTLPNFLITGTPGVGKSTFAGRVAELLNEEYKSIGEAQFRVLNVGELIRQSPENVVVSWDEERDGSVFDEDAVQECLLQKFKEVPNGGWIIDFHSPIVCPCDFIDCFVLLRADTATIYDRLVDRGYKVEKVQENVQCEIYGVVAEELQESLDLCGKEWNLQESKNQFEFQNNTLGDMDLSLLAIQQWYRQSKFC